MAEKEADQAEHPLDGCFGATETQSLVINKVAYEPAQVRVAMPDTGPKGAAWPVGATLQMITPTLMQNFSDLHKQHGRRSVAVQVRSLLCLPTAEGLMTD